MRVQGLQHSTSQSLQDVIHAEDTLEGFVEWLLANGVRGLGRDDSNVALYEEEEHGVRGVICLKVGLHACCAITAMDTTEKKTNSHSHWVCAVYSGAEAALSCPTVPTACVL